MKPSERLMGQAAMQRRKVSWWRWLVVLWHLPFAVGAILAYLDAEFERRQKEATW